MAQSYADLARSLPQNFWDALSAQRRYASSTPNGSTWMAVAGGALLGAGLTLMLAPELRQQARNQLGRVIRGLDPNARFARKAQAEGGFPGPIKHMGP